jgi:hypothetical protein
VGFNYGNKAGTPNGLTNLALKGGGTGRIGAKGKGANLAVPTQAFTMPVQVQMKRRDTGACWEAVYSQSSVNIAGRFKAKSD